MDTLTSSVSTLKIPASPFSSSRELYNLKSPTTAFLHHPPPSLSSSTKPTTKTTSFSRKNLKNSPLCPSPTSKTSSLSNSPTPNNKTHRRPAVGYAAALLDKALCENSLESVRRDVRRLSRLLKNEQIQSLFKEPLMGEKEKGEIVKEVVKIRKVNGYLGGLVKMLIERNKVGIIGECLVEEFERIYDELTGVNVEKVPNFVV